MTVNTPMAKGRATRALERAPRPMKLEIGGLEKRPGWVITNVNAVARNYMDATTTWPIEDEAVQFVFSDNVIEHIPLEAGRTMLAEAYRCMVPGGVIRIVTPDIRRHVELYLAGSSSVDHPVADAYRNLGLTVEYPVDLIRIPIGCFGHHQGYLYDFETLEIELKRAGFHSVVQCEMGESAYPELRGLDKRDDQEGAQLVVEATR
jgi:hypothetical protein